MRKAFVFAIFFILSSSIVHSLVVGEPDEMSKPKDYGVVVTDNGDVFNKIDDNTLVITKDDKFTFNVLSEHAINYRGDVKKTTEWEYVGFGGYSSEILKSNKRLIRKGDLLCIDEPLIMKSVIKNKWVPELYKFECIYYPRQRYNVSKIPGVTIWKDNRTFEKVDDYTYRIKFSLPYDPTSTYTIVSSACNTATTECNGTVYGAGGIMPKGDENVQANIIFYNNIPTDIGYYNFSVSVDAGLLDSRTIYYNGVMHNASYFDSNDEVSIAGDHHFQASEPGWKYTWLMLANAEQQVGTNEYLVDSSNNSYWGMFIYGQQTGGYFYSRNGSVSSNEGMNAYKDNYETYCFALSADGQDFTYIKNGSQIGTDFEESVDRLVSDGTKLKLGNQDSNETFVSYVFLNDTMTTTEADDWCNSKYGCGFQVSTNFSKTFNLSGNNRANVSLGCVDNDGDTDCCFYVSGNDTEFCSNTDDIILADGNDRTVKVVLKTNDTCKVPILTSITLETWNETTGASTSNYCGCTAGQNNYINFTAGCYYNSSCNIDGYDFIAYGSGTVTINATFTADNLTDFDSGQTIKLTSPDNLVLTG